MTAVSREPLDQLIIKRPDDGDVILSISRFPDRSIEVFTSGSPPATPQAYLEVEDSAENRLFPRLPEISIGAS